METFLAIFLPLFVAIDPPGVLPMFIGLTEKLTDQARRRLTIQAVTTALVVGVVLLFTGQMLFRTLGITVNDLRVGGGLILLLLAVSDLLIGDDRDRKPVDPASVGVVPIGIPLIMGPGAITTILVSQKAYGYPMTLLALAANLLLVFLAFYFGPTLMRLLGPNVAKAIGKVANLFLAAIAVAMIRVGILGMIAEVSTP